MTGYEDLTPDQLMLIGYLATYCITVFISGNIIRSLIQMKTAKYVHLRIEKEIVAELTKEIIQKKPFIVKIKEWWEKRKLKKEEKLWIG